MFFPVTLLQLFSLFVAPRTLRRRCTHDKGYCYRHLQPLLSTQRDQRPYRVAELVAPSVI